MSITGPSAPGPRMDGAQPARCSHAASLGAFTGDMETAAEGPEVARTALTGGTTDADAATALG